MYRYYTPLSVTRLIKKCNNRYRYHVCFSRNKLFSFCFCVFSTTPDNNYEHCFDMVLRIVCLCKYKNVSLAIYYEYNATHTIYIQQHMTHMHSNSHIEFNILYDFFSNCDFLSVGVEYGKCIIVECGVLFISFIIIFFLILFF